MAFERLEELLNRYPLRGLKGPVGTQQDLLDLYEGDAAKVEELELRVANQLGFERTLDAVGQIYPRSLDLDVVSSLVQTVSPLGNLALQIRLMAGLDLATEGFVVSRLLGYATQNERVPRNGLIVSQQLWGASHDGLFDNGRPVE